MADLNDSQAKADLENAMEVDETGKATGLPFPKMDGGHVGVQYLNM